MMKIYFFNIKSKIKEIFSFFTICPVIKFQKKNGQKIFQDNFKKTNSIMYKNKVKR